ncbi:hypothetical protein [Rhizobium leguminosarum]|uniref:hypothetical protein n=1 Tax=Rhizobium leguminosarum TaxID=384 RepID=UPI003F9BC463
MGFISLSEAADRLGISLLSLRDLIDRTDRKETILDPDPTADFWSSSTAVIPERDLRTYEHMLARRRFVRFRDRYADVLVDEVELSCRPGWKSLLERVAERLRWMPPAWNVRLRKAREKSGYLILGIEYDSDREDARNEIARLREEVRLSSLSVCEECGRHGRFRYSPSRSLTLCDRHARLSEPTLPGDGAIADPALDGGRLGKPTSD